MNFLFIDIECANCFNSLGKICEFGYILTDGYFNIVEKKQIIINPECSFDRYALKNILNYKKSEYRSAPVFSEYYNEIRKLLLSPDQIVFGHATANDARFLKDSSARYNLEQIDFEFCDVGKLYKNYFNLQETASLKRMCDNFEIETEETAHVAANDAESTMLVLKSLCKEAKSMPNELIEQFPESYGRLVIKDKSKLKRRFKNL